MSEIKDDIWQDPMVKEALQERPAEDIAVLNCPDCCKLGYYNQGSHFTCRFCNVTFLCISEGEETPEGRRYLTLDDHLTLADVSEFEEGP
jgi:hypothetical protein